MMTLYKPNMPGGYEWSMDDRMKSEQARVRKLLGKPEVT